MNIKLRFPNGLYPGRGTPTVAPGRPQPGVPSTHHTRSRRDRPPQAIKFPKKSLTLGNTSQTCYIMANSSIVAMYKKTSSGGNMYYVHTDHLGSVNFVTNYMKNRFC